MKYDRTYDRLDIRFFNIVPTEERLARCEAERFYYQHTDSIEHTPVILKCATAVDRRPCQLIENDEDYKLLTGFYEGDGCPGNPEMILRRKF